MIDKLSLTIHAAPNIDYLKYHGEIKEDKTRRSIYKNMCRLDRALVLYYPHKFSDSINARIAFTKIELNPKNFECYDHMEAYVLAVFSEIELSIEEINISRVDIAVDLEDFNIEHVLASLHIKHINNESLNIYKKTIYAGSDPKLRIYNKIKEIKNRIRKGLLVSEYERNLLDSGREYTRFEIQIRNNNLNLKSLSDNPESLASYFDRLEFLNFKKKCSSIIMQFIYKKMNRKFRAELEKFRDLSIVQAFKERYVKDVTEWFSSKEPF